MIKKLLFATGALLMCGTAQAAADLYCSTSHAMSGIAVSDVTYNTANANDCYGVVSSSFSGASAINGLNLTWGNDWAYLDATDNTSGTYLGIKFTVTENTSTNTWLLTGTDTNGSAPLNLPAGMDIAIAIKTSSAYALWYFDNVVFDGSDGGGWKATFTSKCGGGCGGMGTSYNIVALGRDAKDIPPSTVPVPAAAWLLGSGLIGLVGAGARKRK